MMFETQDSARHPRPQRQLVRPQSATTGAHSTAHSLFCRKKSKTAAKPTTADLNSRFKRHVQGRASESEPFEEPTLSVEFRRRLNKVESAQTGTAVTDSHRNNSITPLQHKPVSKIFQKRCLSKVTSSGTIKQMAVEHEVAKRRPISTYRHDNTTRDVFTEQSRRKVTHLKHFISQQPNKDTVRTQMNQQSAKNIKTVRIDSTVSAGGQNAHANSITTAQSPSIKKSMERKLTRNTIYNTVDQNSRGGLTQNSSNGGGGFVTVQSNAQNSKMPSLGIRECLKLNQCSEKKLKDIEKIAGPVQFIPNGQVKIDHANKASIIKPLLLQSSQFDTNPKQANTAYPASHILSQNPFNQLNSSSDTSAYKTSLSKPAFTPNASLLQQNNNTICPNDLISNAKLSKQTATIDTKMSLIAQKEEASANLWNQVPPNGKQLQWTKPVQFMIRFKPVSGTHDDVKLPQETQQNVKTEADADR